MRVLLDTNVILDVLQKRAPWFESGRKLFLAIANNQIQGCFTAKQAADIYFFSRKQFKEETNIDEKARQVVSKLYALFELMDTTAEDCQNALSIDSRAFKECKNITGIDLGNKIQEIPDRAFEICESLESITIPSSVKYIGSFAFTGCINLREVILQEGLLTIENTAFNWCHNLHSLHLPASLKSINTYITEYNNGLGEFFFEGMDTEIEDAQNGKFPHATMHVKHGSRAEQFAMKNNIRCFFDL